MARCNTPQLESNMPTLLEIGDELGDVLALIEDNSGELDSYLSVWFEKIQEDLQNKADNYACLVRELELRATARKAEAERLAELSATDANLAKRLKARLLAFMEMNSIPRIDTARYRITVAKNGGLVPVKVTVTGEELPPSYQRHAITPDLDAIRDALMAGKEVVGAALLPRGSHLRIG